MTIEEAIKERERFCDTCKTIVKPSKYGCDKCSVPVTLEVLQKQLDADNAADLTPKERALEAITKAIESVEINIESTYHNEDMKEAAEAIFKLSQAFANINAFPLK